MTQISNVETTMKDKIILFLATGCYVGNIPFVPGTFGSAAALVLCGLVSGLSLFWGIGFILLFTIFSVIIADGAEKMLGEKDPGCIVIDEFAGMLVTFLGIGFTVSSVIWGFFIFRFFDILKPYYPVGYFEQKFSGGKGIVFDDIAAGIMSNIVLRIIL